MEREDDEPVEMSLHELGSLDLSHLKDGETLWIMESEFPETTIRRDGVAK